MLPKYLYHWHNFLAYFLFFLSNRTLFASSVLNLAELVALRPDLARLKKVLYFHENQLVYPVRKQQDRDFQYGYNQILSRWVCDCYCVQINSPAILRHFLATHEILSKIFRHSYSVYWVRSSLNGVQIVRLPLKRTNTFHQSAEIWAQVWIEYLFFSLHWYSLLWQFKPYFYLKLIISVLQTCYHVIASITVCTVWIWSWINCLANALEIFSIFLFWKPE